jgi:tetratricopeptide (TPR) repeat protein
VVRHKSAIGPKILGAEGVAVLTALFLILLVIPDAAIAQAEGAPTAVWAHDALARALSACDDITDSFHRAQALAEISEAQVAAGEIDAARSNLARALSTAREIDAEPLRNWATHDIGLAYVKADDLSAAEAAAETIRDVRLHDAVLAAVVDARRGARDLPGALATARRIRDVSRQGFSLRAIAIQQASENDFTAAVATARSIQHWRANALALGDVAAAIARVGSFEEASSLAAQIKDAPSRSRAFVEVAVAEANMGGTRAALATLASVNDNLDRAEATARVAAVRASAAPDEARDMFAQALGGAGKVRAGANRKADTFIEIARAQLIAGETAGASATLKRAFGQIPGVKDDTERLNLLSRIAPLQARAGDYPGAFSTAMRADDASLRPLLVRDIAASQAEKGDVAGAVAIARSLDDRAAAAAALFGILRVQSQAHDVSGLRETIGVTLQTVRVIGSAELRAGALGSLAAAHAREGDVEGAQAVFAEAMNTAAATDRGQQRAAVYARIADSLADRHRPLND